MALERRPAKSNLRLLKVAAAVAALSIVAVVAVKLWPSRVLPSSSQQQKTAALAAPSLVRVSGADGREAGAVVLRRLGQRLVVLAPATIAPSGRVVEVKGSGGSAQGFSLWSGGAPEIDQLAVVFVPDVGPMQVAEPKLATRPALDQPLVALTAGGQPAAAGLVLSLNDGEEAGSLVHDVALNVAERGYGFWSPDGRLFALASFAPVRGESLALATNALAARLLVHELPLLADGSFSEHSLPMVKGSRLGVAAQAKRLELRIGGGTVQRGREAFDGWRSIDLSVTRPGALQVAATAPRGSAFAVTLAPF